MRRYTFDLDNTLCLTKDGDYANAQPIPERIAQVNALFDAGHHIFIDTARGTVTEVDHRALTEQQLWKWGVKYHELRVGDKPFAHVYVGDEAVNADDFFTQGHPERWPDEYFAERVGNDPRRQKSFDAERRFLSRHDAAHAWPPFFRGTVCDVGCSTGEFLSHSGFFVPWQANAYGMEISPHAQRIAESRGIRFDRNITTERDFFDVVVFRGTIQHVPEPFRYIRLAHRSLKSGGHIAFLATPNTDSLVYRLFGELPVSDPTRNYWMPSASTLTNALKNFGFEIVAVEYPYLDGGYARPIRDAFAFLNTLLGQQRPNFPWPKNMMNVIARKP